MLSALIAALIAQASPSLPEWITFEIVNADRANGHSILHLEDLLRPEGIAGVPKPSALLLFSVREADCLPQGGGLCELVGELTRSTKGLLPIAVMLGTLEVAQRARRRLVRSAYSFPISVDPHGLVAKALKLNRPGVFIVVNSDGSSTRKTLPPNLGTQKLQAEKARFEELIRMTISSAMSTKARVSAQKRMKDSKE